MFGRVGTASSATAPPSLPADQSTCSGTGLFSATLAKAKSPTRKSAAPRQTPPGPDLNQLVSGLNGDGDQFTVSMQAGGRIGLPLEELDIPGVGGPQAQYGYDVTVKQVGSGPDAQYQVTFNKDLMAGANLEVSGPGAEIDGAGGSVEAGLVVGGESNLISSGTVTMTFSSKKDLSRGLGALQKEVEAQTLRDAGSLIDPRVAIATPAIPSHDVTSLQHDGSSLISDAKTTAKNGMKVLSDLLPGCGGNLLPDLGSFGGSVLHTAGDGVKTAGDVAWADWDSTSAELVNTLADNGVGSGNFIRNPLDQWPSGTTVPLGGPVGQFGAGALNSAAAQVGPSAADLKFLQQHITGYSVTIGTQDRARVEAGLGGTASIGPAQLVARAIGQPRLADNTQITIAETLPQNGKPGTVSVTFSGNVNLDARAVAALKADFKVDGQGYQGFGSEIPDPNIASATGSVTLTWNLSAAQGQQLAKAGHSLPITALIPASRLAHPDSLTAKLDAQVAVPVVLQNGRWVPSGSASHETLADFSATATYNDPQVALKVLRGAGNNPLAVFPTLTGSSQRTQTQLVLYDQHGLPVQTELGGRINDVIEGKVWLYQRATSEHLIFSSATQPKPQPKPVQPPVPKPPQPYQLVVLPFDGLNVRAAPNIDGTKIGAFSSGTFVDTTGKTAVDAQGRTWIEVTGPDSNRQVVTGWVAAPYVTPHPQGGEDATGRIDQTLRSEGYFAVTVRPGDTIDGIAARYGKDPAQAVAVNNGHIIDPNLIFPGDTVYLPG